MFSSQSTEVSLNAPCRALAAVRADKVGKNRIHRRFRFSNRITFTSSDFASEVNELGADATIPHETYPVT
jgi:hypothetical protein